MRTLRTPAFAALAALVLTAIAVTAVLAQDELLGGKFRSGNAVTIAEDETVTTDVYAFAGNVTINGTVEGDLVAAAGQVVVNGTVTGDVIAAGGSVSVSGTVDGDARIAGGQLNISGEVGEDALLTGGQVALADGGRVGGDLIFSAGQATLDGDVEGNILGAAEAYTRTGSVGGSERVDTAADRPDDDDEDDDVADRITNAVQQYVVVLLIGALGVWLVPRALTAAAETVRRRPLPALGVGLLTLLGLIAGSVAFIIVMVLFAIVFGLVRLDPLVGVTLLGGLLTLFVTWFVFWLVAAFLVDAIVGLALASLVAPLGGSRWRLLGLLAAGAAVVVILSSLPFAGWLVKLLVIVLGVGALFLAGWGSWRRRGGSPPSEPAATVA